MEIGTAITHTASSGDITLAEAGDYLVSYHAVATVSASGSPPVTPSLQFNLQGTVVPGTVSTGTISTNGNTLTFAATAIVNASAGNVLTLVPANTDGAFTNTGVTVLKLG